MPVDYVHKQTAAKSAPTKRDEELEAARREVERVTSAYQTGRDMYERLHAAYTRSQGGAGADTRELEDSRKQLARAQQAATMERERADRQGARGDALAAELAKTQEAKRAVEKLNTELARGDRTQEARLTKLHAAEATADAQRKRADALASKGEALARAEGILGHIDVILGVCQNSCHPEVRGQLREAQETIREFVRNR